MARKKASTQSMSDQFLDWFEDQADPIEQEYVLNYLARLQRRGGNGRTAQTSSNAPATGSVPATRKPRSTGAEAKTERQAKVSQPVIPSKVKGGDEGLNASLPVARRTGFGGARSSSSDSLNISKVQTIDEGDGKVDTE